MHILRRNFTFGTITQNQFWDPGKTLIPFWISDRLQIFLNSFLHALECSDKSYFFLFLSNTGFIGESFKCKSCDRAILSLCRYPHPALWFVTIQFLKFNYFWGDTGCLWTFLGHCFGNGMCLDLDQTWFEKCPKLTPLHSLDHSPHLTWFRGQTLLFQLGNCALRRRRHALRLDGPVGLVEHRGVLYGQLIHMLIRRLRLDVQRQTWPTVDQ